MSVAIEPSSTPPTDKAAFDDEFAAVTDRYGTNGADRGPYLADEPCITCSIISCGAYTDYCIYTVE